MSALGVKRTSPLALQRPGCNRISNVQIGAINEGVAHASRPAKRPRLCPRFPEEASPPYAPPATPRTRTTKVDMLVDAIGILHSSQPGHSPLHQRQQLVAFSEAFDFGRQLQVAC